MSIIPKKFNFTSDYREPKVSEASVFGKLAFHDDVTLNVRKINEKYCVHLTFGEGDVLPGVFVFGVANENDAIEAAIAGAVRAKLAKREKN